MPSRGVRELRGRPADAHAYTVAESDTGGIRRTHSDGAAGHDAIPDARPHDHAGQHPGHRHASPRRWVPRPAGPINWNFIYKVGGQEVGRQFVLGTEGGELRLGLYTLTD